jgi:hypothetical protein
VSRIATKDVKEVPLIAYSLSILRVTDSNCGHSLRASRFPSPEALGF